MWIITLLKFSIFQSQLQQTPQWPNTPNSAFMYTVSHLMRVQWPSLGHYHLEMMLFTKGLMKRKRIDRISWNLRLKVWTFDFGSYCSPLWYQTYDEIDAKLVQCPYSLLTEECTPLMNGFIGLGPIDLWLSEFTLLVLNWGRKIRQSRSNSS